MKKMITYIKYNLPRLLYSKLEKCNFSSHEVLSLYNKETFTEKKSNNLKLQLFQDCIHLFQ